MDIFALHNTHLEDNERFENLDPQLRYLKQMPYVYEPHLLEELPFDIPGIYSVTGGRQIGKTTLIKLWMYYLMEKQNVSPQCIYYMTGELIADQERLLFLLRSKLEEIPQNTLAYIIIDEVTDIKDWDKIIKFAADAGMLQNIVLVLTGSDSVLIQEARMRFPGRRGRAAKVDFHYYTLSFREFVTLTRPDLEALRDTKHSFSENQSNRLREAFKEYLYHGGYLTAINEYASEGTISAATLSTYSDWIRGDMVKRSKNELYLKELLGSIIKRYNTQITWNALAQDLSIDHPSTVSDYAISLSALDAIYILDALVEDKLTAAPKKAKKLLFTDPFIYHAIQYWLSHTSNPFEEIIKPNIESSEISSKLVEACVATHIRRYYPTYYIKAESEVDVAYVKDNRFWPIEVKWTNQLRTKDLKQIKKYNNGKIYSKVSYQTTIEEIPVIPLPEALFNMPESL